MAPTAYFPSGQAFQRVLSFAMFKNDSLTKKPILTLKSFTLLKQHNIL